MPAALPPRPALRGGLSPGEGFRGTCIEGRGRGPIGRARGEAVISLAPCPETAQLGTGGSPRDPRACLSRVSAVTRISMAVPSLLPRTAIMLLARQPFPLVRGSVAPVLRAAGAGPLAALGARRLLSSTPALWPPIRVREVFPAVPWRAWAWQDLIGARWILPSCPVLWPPCRVREDLPRGTVAGLGLDGPFWGEVIMPSHPILWPPVRTRRVFPVACRRA